MSSMTDENIVAQQIEDGHIPEEEESLSQVADTDEPGGTEAASGTSALSEYFRGSALLRTILSGLQEKNENFILPNAALAGAEAARPISFYYGVLGVVVGSVVAWAVFSTAGKHFMIYS
jgi:hypothetical protein